VTAGVISRKYVESDLHYLSSKTIAYIVVTVSGIICKLQLTPFQHRERKEKPSLVSPSGLITIILTLTLHVLINANL
jgi:hypothetical protein